MLEFVFITLNNKKFDNGKCRWNPLLKETSEVVETLRNKMRATENLKILRTRKKEKRVLFRNQKNYTCSKLSKYAKRIKRSKRQKMTGIVKTKDTNCKYKWENLSD